MGTGAERQRRHRAHIKGDHSLCDPMRRCDETASMTTVTRDPYIGPKLNASGRRLWADLGGNEATGDRRVLIVEACRITDRLDKLDKLLSGVAADWVRLLEQRGHEDVVEVVIDKPLSEARQQATALARLVAELRQSGPKAVGQPEQGKGGSAVADLTARIAARRARTTG